jgi:hypothetical protein
MAKFMCTSKKIRPWFPEARSYTTRGVHPAALLSLFISSRRSALSDSQTSASRQAIDANRPGPHGGPDFIRSFYLNGDLFGAIA